ncbi:MAG TPA: DUF1801 domain-containing protein [Longimicrobium sp.]|nr:DUF1801 domain-containing protein [Longimicrobium sp.]
MATPPGAAARPMVEEFLATLDHPSVAAIRAAREAILGADAAIGEGIKWNAPSFRTGEWFATFHLRAKDGVQVILHTGAKKRDDLAAGMAVADPDGLLQWLSADRATVKFRDLDDVKAKRAAFAAVIREWIRYVQPGNWPIIPQHGSGGR